MDDIGIAAEEGKQERYLHWADLSGLVLLLGLVVEFVYVFFSNASLSEIIWTLASDALIITGVAGELQFARRAKKSGDRLQVDMKARLTEALTRAARAEEKLAPRSMSSTQIADLGRTLREFAGTRVDVVSYAPGYPEVNNACGAIATAFAAGHWAVNTWTAIASRIAVSGIFVAIRADASLQEKKAAETFRKCLSEIGWDLRRHTSPVNWPEPAPFLEPAGWIEDPCRSGRWLGSSPERQQMHAVEKRSQS